MRMRDESNRALFAGLERADLLVTAMRFSAGEVTTAASLSQSTRGFRCFWARVVTPIHIAEFVVHVLEPPVGTIGGFLSAHTLILKPSGMLPPKAWLPPLRHFANTFVPR